MNKSQTSRARSGLWLGSLALIAGAAGGYYLLRPAPAVAPAWSTDLAAAQATARQRDRRLLIAFTTERCPGCRKMETVLEDAAVRHALAAFVPVRIDPLKDTARAGRFGVDSLPTFVVADGDGRMLARKVGVQPAAAFTEFLERAAALPSVTADAAAASLPEWMARGARTMVAADSPYASQAGLDILRAGGNAFDAAAAVSFALAVVRPESTGAGGGGFLVARFSDGRAVALDFRECAPARATPDMYLAGPGGAAVAPDASRNGHLAAGVPGLVAGRCEALKRWGSMPLARVLDPAIRLAENGFAVDDAFVAASREALKAYEARPELKASCGYVYRTFLGGGTPLSKRHVLRQPALAAFLKRLAAEGPEFFYKGDFSAALERCMREHGGIIQASDLAGYQVKERTPLRGTYREFSLITMPPPSSGGVALVEALNILEIYPMPDLKDNDVRPGPHLLVESLKHAFADRARYLADPDFSSVPVERLTSKNHGRMLGVRIQRALPGVLPIEAYGAAQLPDDEGTSHFCVVDGGGTIVSSTETINTEFGSLAAVEEWGVILNNEMDDFATQPGRPNAFGLLQSDRNRVEPGKRPLSSMAPAIVLKDERPVMALGASGGPRVISGVLNVLVNVLDYGLPLEQAMTQPRLHHQWQPDQVFFDRPPQEAVAAILTAKGHTISEERRGAIVQVVLREGESWLGASDPRKGGRPAGE